ncbi:MAG: DUF1631 family protein [Burkholderiales bacterium]|nr:DUF1631 family protein [Burkholderiales bacterium]
MKPNPVHRLPAPIESAVQRLKLAAREAAERTIESLGLAALASNNAFQRDGLLGAQFELNRKSAVFALTFNDAYDRRVLLELGPRASAAEVPAPSTRSGSPLTDWAALSLVEDKEVEAQISAERFALEIAHGCEWELRELEGYVGSLLGEAGGERDRNPLRPELIGQAMIAGIDAVSDRDEIRKVLSSELGRSLAGLLARAYADIVSGMRNAGVQPLGMAVRQRGTRSGPLGDSQHGNSGFEASAHGGGPDSRHGRQSGHSSHSGPSSGHGGASTQSGYYGGAPSMGQVDPALMTLIRRLSHGGHLGELWTDDGGGSGGSAPRNLIHDHRDELRQASTGALDHMVIDVIGFLFDQILADPKVPPQMARQIARLQLPVLRAALGDPSFFSSRRHPVRRFVNRIASLGSAFEDYGDAVAGEFLAKVKALVHEVVEGDFDRIEVYEQKLAALEAYTADIAARAEPEQEQAANLLSEKEDQQRLRQLYAQRLAGDLKGLAAPPFLRDFLSDVWSQVLLRAAEQDGADGELVQRLRGVGRELYLSIQPKATPALRKAFLAELPRLMQSLTEGMNLIAWPEAQRRAFFGDLMPAHAEALKVANVRQLDINLAARQVEGALKRPPPSRAELLATRSLPVLSDAIASPVLTPEEARRVGLVTEAAVDWSAPVSAPEGETGETGEAAADGGPESEPALPGLPVSADAADPSEGRALADHVQIGYPYQMHLDGEWRRVRLSHVSAARSFFIFTHGARNRQTVSLTQRMLLRLCETGRFRAFETATLIDRATARARRQLAALGSARA